MFWWNLRQGKKSFFLSHSKHPQPPLWSVRVAGWLALPTLDHKDLGSNPAGGGIQLMTVRRLVAQSLSLSSFHNLLFYLLHIAHEISKKCERFVEHSLWGVNLFKWLHSKQWNSESIEFQSRKDEVQFIYVLDLTEMM